MDPIARLSLIGLVAFLFAKLVFLIAVQGRRRAISGIYRWPEDATRADGRVAAEGEDPLVERAQGALRNDSESQVLFLLAATWWVLSGARGLDAACAFIAYAGARGMHTYYFMRPRQPARTLAFGAGHVVTLAVIADGLWISVYAWRH